MAMHAQRKVQTNLKLLPEAAAALDVAAALEGKDKAEIVAEALELRQALMGNDYGNLVQHALAVRQSSDPVERLRAVEALREEVAGATPGGSVTVTAALARLRSRASSRA